MGDSALGEVDTCVKRVCSLLNSLDYSYRFEIEYFQLHLPET